ncbi:WD40 repeat-like protein [Choiromyces venosus 120613-1]|uniref:WD40 repeat-like protein n=1 Tax=Choiromyces venosus 120613-1 TaxID=1336337 RepID=A0A3N4JV60_9PEZI|nr:WD40 repeat-like protein [Choiromyces venosus 120613-1]
MSSTKTPQAVKGIEKPNEPGEKDNSENSTKEPSANAVSLAVSEEAEERKKRKNRYRARRRKESKNAVREGLTETKGIVTKEVKEFPKEDRIVKVAVSKQPNKPPQTPKKKGSGEPKPFTPNAVVVAEDNGGSGVSGWRMSSALGGRFLPLDMVFSLDEKFFLLAHSCSLKVYSTKTSLQVREFNLESKPSEAITTFKLDPLDPSKVYIGTSTATIYSVDWTTGKLVQSFQLSNIRAIQSLEICADEEGKNEKTYGILYVSGSRSKNPSTIIQRVTLLLSGAPVEDRVYALSKSSPIECMQVLDQGNIVTAIAGNTLVIGNKNTEEDSSDKKSWGVFRRYPMSFRLACMDSYLSSESDITNHKGKKSSRDSGREANKLGDVVVGDNQGALHLFHNVLRVRGTSKGPPVISKMHWHRTRVQAVKWALDGKYIISGGSETVLVIWQLGTGFKQFLPHLGATIQNITISPKGSSYGVGFADNSVMVLSTTEFKPTSSVTGIQSRVFSLEKHAEYPRFTCVMHPTLPNRLLLASPSSQADIHSSASSLQTFDISSNRQVYRQAMTRNNITSVNQGPDEYKIKEPDLPHLAITKDGKWMALIDEWKPPKKKAFHSNEDEPSPQEDDNDQREISLKFWKWNEKSLSWELATIVKSPHPSSSSTGPEEVLDLVAASKAHLFATLAADGSIRLWKPKVRVRDGARARGEDSQITVWSCRKVIKFSKGKKERQVLAQNLLNGMSPQKAWWGSVAFSEDNSVIAAAVPNSLGDDSAIYLADPSSGTIAHFLSGLQVGKTAKIAILERYLIILGTSKLLVWNMVNGTVQWEFNLKTLLSTDNPVMHLAVDYVSQTFAVTISQRDAQSPKIFVFEASHSTPVHLQPFEHGYQVMALLATDTGKGYVALDNQARVRCLSPILAGPVQRIPSEEEDEQARVVAGAAEEDEPTIGTLSGAYLSTTTPTMTVGGRMDIDYANDDDGVIDNVVSREALENILDATPSYAIGSLEFKFNQVLDLFAKTPLLDSDDDDKNIPGSVEGEEDVVAEESESEDEEDEDEEDEGGGDEDEEDEGEEDAMEV